MNDARSQRGQRRVISTSIDGGAYKAQGLTQLIGTRESKPSQWVVTLMQPVAGNGTSPWASPFDSVVPGVTPGADFTAPTIPKLSPMYVALRWGAGGVAFETQFDYPASGGVFGVAADTLDLNVGFRGAVPSWATAAEVPIVGAIMVPGVCASTTPLRWRETGAGLNLLAIGAAQGTFWAVKPYARSLRVASPDIATKYSVTFYDRAANTLWSEIVELGAAIGTSQRFDVPASAVMVNLFSNSAGASTWAAEWEIGLT